MTIHHLPTVGRAFQLLVLLCLAAGCANKKAELRALELQTRITDGGLKLFEVTFPMPARPLTLPTGERPRKPRPETSARQMQNLLDEIMAQSQYCRDGYVLLGRYAGETTRRLRGECKDRATDEDRQRFPDTVERW